MRKYDAVAVAYPMLLDWLLDEQQDVPGTLVDHVAFFCDEDHSHLDSTRPRYINDRLSDTCLTPI